MPLYRTPPAPQPSPIPVPDITLSPLPTRKSPSRQKSPASRTQDRATVEWRHNPKAALPGESALVEWLP